MSLYDNDLQMLGAILNVRPMTMQQAASFRPTQQISASRGSVLDSRAALADRVADQVAEPFPGVPGAQAGVVGLGLTVAAFVNAGPTSITVTGAPQKPFKPKRFVANAIYGAAAAAAVTITAFLIDSTNILPGGSPWSIAPYGPTAINTTLDLPPTGRGGIITITYTLVGPALGVGDTITVTSDFIGPSFV